MCKIHSFKCAQKREVLRIHQLAKAKVEDPKIRHQLDVQILYAQVVLDASRMLRLHETRCVLCKDEIADAYEAELVQAHG